MSGRPQTGIKAHRAEIERWYITENRGVSGVKRALLEAGIPASESSIKRALRDWGFTKNARLQSNTALIERVIALYPLNISLENTLHALEADGYSVTIEQLKQIRLKRPMPLLYGPPRDIGRREDLERSILAAIEEGNRTGQIRSWGYRRVKTWLRTEGIYASEEQVQVALRRVCPSDVANRANIRACRRSYYIVKGPNAVLSIDGYDKLSPYGFQIYGFIDGYSRFVRLLYVGISNRTAVSVNKQYLELLRQDRLLPRLVRSDKGKETLLMATSHYLLHKADDPDVALKQVWSYGRSIYNIRIESFWSRLATGQANELRVLFQELERTGHFTREDSIDINAMRYIYMPLVRQFLHTFIDVHNRTAIRTQKNRPYLPTGQPVMLWRYPRTAQICGSAADERTLAQLTEQMSDYDLEPYLHPSTEMLCQNILRSNGYPLTYTALDDNTRDAYIFLRGRMQCIARLGQPILDLEQPKKAFKWVERHYWQEYKAAEAQEATSDEEITTDLIEERFET